MYFITNMDIWLLMQKFQIPSAILSSKTILQTDYKKYAFITYNNLNFETNTCYIFSSGTRQNNENVAPKYKMVQSSEGEIFVGMKNECVNQEKWGDILTIEKYLTNFSKKKYRKFQKIRKKWESLFWKKTQFQY